jgi:hypothetical protein
MIVTMTVTRPVRTKSSLVEQFFLKNSYTEFHENSAGGLLAETRLQTERQALSAVNVLLFIL